MEIKVLEDKNNPLLQRREIRFVVSQNLGTPSRKEIKDKLAAYLNSKPELVIIERMRAEFGKRETRGYAKIYESMERLKSVETEHIIQRNEKKPAPKVEKAAEGGAKPAAETKAETKPPAKVEKAAEGGAKPTAETKAEAKPAPKEEKKA